jgi:hypothetical protein
MPVAARVVQVRLRSASVALVNATAHLGRAASRQGSQHFAMLQRESVLVACNEGGSVTTYHFADFGRWWPSGG